MLSDLVDAAGKRTRREQIDPGLLFLDSGAHSLYAREVLANGRDKGYAYFKSAEFWQYVDDYAAYLKAHPQINLYVTVDVIFNPKASWKVLKYMEEEHGLKPLPVIHYGTPLRWIEKHLEAGYEFLGIGGLGQEAKRKAYLTWADGVFALICPAPSRLPVARTHGFAMTAYQLLTRYPWWSVDSVSWAKAAGFGSIYIPHKRQGAFTFAEEPYVVAVSSDSPKAKVYGKHLSSWTLLERNIFHEWLETIGMPLGSIDSNGEAVDWGVVSQYEARAIANLKFFETLRCSLPEYPWAFTARGRRSFF